MVENLIHHHMTCLTNLCLNGDILFELLRSPECLTDGSWLGPIPLQTNEQRSSTKQSLEEKKGRRKTGERKCCGVENVNYKNRTTQQKLSLGKNRRQICFLKSLFISGATNSSASKNIRCKINKTRSHLLLLRNYMKEVFWQEFVNAEKTYYCSWVASETGPHLFNKTGAVFFNCKRAASGQWIIDVLC